MKHLEIIDTSIKDLKIIVRTVARDNRGYFSRLYCAKDLCALGYGFSVAQINHSQTNISGSVRGLHFQHPPHAEIKLVSCIRGAVWDVAVDLRENSETFLKWHAEVLSPINNKALLIPKGFAHGFQSLTDDCELVYIHSELYMPSSEGGVNPIDPLLSIEWPRELTETSSRDTNCPFLTEKFKGLVI